MRESPCFWRSDAGSITWATPTRLEYLVRMTGYKGSHVKISAEDVLKLHAEGYNRFTVPALLEIERLKGVRPLDPLRLIRKVAALNPDAGEIGAGMLKQLVTEAQEILKGFGK